LIRLLAIDTTTRWGSLALVAGEERVQSSTRLVAEIGFRVERSHTGQLLRSAEWLLDGAGWSRSGLDGFVATRGPGSFTGIRVGLGTIRGLALAADRPCLGVGALDALAEAHGPAERDRTSLIGAGRGEFYGARFDPDSSPPVAIGEPWAHPRDRLLERCPGETVLVFAPGDDDPWSDTRDLPDRVRVASTQYGIAAAAGRLAILGGLPDPDDESSLVPVYVRPPDAVLGR
jgi:tRNA threonylcarbamoyladenosine biosynthesis protein TsaB